MSTVAPLVMAVSASVSCVASLPSAFWMVKSDVDRPPAMSAFWMSGRRTQRSESSSPCPEGSPQPSFAFGCEGLSVFMARSCC